MHRAAGGLGWAGAALTVVVVAALAAPGEANAKERCRDIGTETRPIAEAATLEIRTPNGPFRFRQAGRSRRCVGVSVPYMADIPGRGLMDARGRRVLVPASYENVVPISDTTALVGTGNDPYRFYDYGVGERGVSPYFGAALLTDGSSATARAWSSANWRQPNGLFVFTGQTDPVVVDGVESFEQLHGVSTNYVMHFTADDGEPVSRLFDPLMNPISPVIGRAETWVNIPLDDDLRAANTDFPVDLVSRSMQLSHPDLPGEQLYIPIAANGEPLTMPAGAIGVMPLKQDIGRTWGWAVVFPTPSGFELAPVHARLETGLAQAASVPRYLGMRRGTNVGTNVMMVREPGGWRVLDYKSLQPLTTPPGDHIFADAESGNQAYIAWWNQVHDQHNQAIADNQAAQVAALWSQGEADWARVLAGQQNICHLHSGAFLPKAGLERFFRECNVGETFLRNIGDGVSAEALTIARARVERDKLARAAALAEQQRLAALAAPPQATADPWARGLAAAQASVDASYNSFVQQQNVVAQRNRAAWNSGAQNWGGPRP